MLTPPLRIFYSYCHDDPQWLAVIRKWVNPLAEDEHLIEAWDDTLLPAGERWQAAIDDELDSCHIFVPLITINFLNSKSCRAEFTRAVELQAASEKNGTGKLPVIAPILCGRSPYRNSQFRRYQPLPGWEREVGHPDDSDRLNEVYGKLRDEILRLCPQGDHVPDPVRRLDVRHPPDLLPYLCDRGVQLRPLRSRLKSLASHSVGVSAPKPLIFIAHGTERECHEGFWIRLSRSELPRQLGGDRERIPPNLLRWPGETPGSYTRGDLDELAPEWNSSGEVHFICVKIPAHRWYGVTGFENMFKFWNSLGELKCRALIIGVFLIYSESPGTAEGDMDRVLRIRFEKRFSNVDTIILPRFESISADDVSEWTDEIYRMAAISDFEHVEINRLLKTHFPTKQFTIPYDEMLDKIQEALRLLRRAS